MGIFHSPKCLAHFWHCSVNVLKGDKAVSFLSRALRSVGGRAPPLVLFLALFCPIPGLLHLCHYAFSGEISVSPSDRDGDRDSRAAFLAAGSLHSPAGVLPRDLSWGGLLL